MATKEDVLKTIETLKEEISSLQSNEDTEKLFQIAKIVENWFFDASYFDMYDKKPNFDRVKESICEDTIDEIVSRVLDTYDAFYDIAKILLH